MVMLRGVLRFLDPQHFRFRPSRWYPADNSFFRLMNQLNLFSYGIFGLTSLAQAFVECCRIEMNGLFSTFGNRQSGSGARLNPTELVLFAGAIGVHCGSFLRPCNMKAT